ncbi:hypothetical protein BDW62DRAFT_75949 [Aspergillus aurantiobrunneus]
MTVITNASKSNRTAVERRPRGYARLAALMTADNQFTMAKRFDTLHMRNILYLQDIIAETESLITALDEAETCQTFLSSRRYDGNAERQKLLQDLNQLLEAYDNAVLRYQSLLQLPQANSGAKASVRNWVLAKKPLVRSESQVFLDNEEETDIVALKPTDNDFDHGVIFRLFAIGVTYAPRMSKLLFSSLNTRRKSEDPQVILLSSHSVMRFLRMVHAIVAALWLVTPVLVLNCLSTVKYRSLVLTVFLVALALATATMERVRKYEILISVATYCTVLVVFFDTNRGDA